MTVWDSQLSASLLWSMTTHWQLGITPVLLQKNHVTPGGTDSPGDLFVSTKFGSLGSPRAPFKLALQLDVRVPTGKNHNIPLHPYSANSIGYGAMGLLSIHSRPAQSAGFTWDVNLGYFNHNDKGLTLTNGENDTLAVESPTTEIIFGTGAMMMGKRFGLYGEIHGRIFLQQPPVTAYTRENSIYITPGIIYQFNPYIRLVTAVDLVLQGRDDETLYEIDGVRLMKKPGESIPNLPDWRFHFGLSFRLKEGKLPEAKPRPEKAVVVEEEPVKDIKPDKDEEQDLRKLEEQLKRQNDNQVIETEAERQQRMQVERERMLDILQRLREAMDEEKRQSDDESEKSSSP